MLKSIKAMTLLLLVCSFLLSSGLAEAHSIKSDSGYTAVLHIDPDDDPLAGQPAVLNFLIGKDNGSYNQNDYSISVNVSAGGKQPQHLALQPEVFGDAADGIAHYTFSSINVYTIDLRGQLITDPSTQFHMRYIVRVAGASAGFKTSASNKGPIVLLLSMGSLVLVGVIGYVVIRRGRRSAAQRLDH